MASDYLTFLPGNNTYNIKQCVGDGLRVHRAVSVPMFWPFQEFPGSVEQSTEYSRKKLS